MLIASFCKKFNSKISVLTNMLDSNIQYLLNLSNNWICVCSKSQSDFEIVFLNQKTIQDFTISEKKTSPKSIENLFPQLAQLDYFETINQVYISGKSASINDLYLTNELKDLIIANIEIKKLNEFILIEIIDITNQKKQEEKFLMLEEANKMLKIGTWELDMQTGLINSNLDIEYFFESDSKNEKFDLAFYYDHVVTDNIEQVKIDFLEKIKTGKTFTQERKMRTDKGNIKFFEVSCKPIFHLGNCIKIIGTLKDISIRKFQELKVIESEKLLKEYAVLMEQTHSRLKMGTYEVDIQTNIIKTTFNLSEFYELEKKQEVFTLNDFSNYVAKEEQQSSKINIKEAIAKGFSYAKERKIITAIGNEKFLEITGQPVYENGKCYKIFGTLRDITERKKSEIKLLATDIKLKENVERLMTAHNLLRTGTWSLSLTTNQLSLSDEVIEISNHQIPKNLSLLDFFDFFSKENQPSYIETLMSAINNITPITEVIQLCFNDGSYKYIDVIGQFSDDKKTLSGTFRDITEAHETSLALLNSEERLRDLFENTPSIYFIVNMDGTIEDVNQFGCDYLGYKKAELIQLDNSILFHKDDQKNVLKHLELLGHSNENFLQCEVRERKKNGEIIWVKLTARISFNRNRKSIYLIVCEDISSEVINRTLVRKKQEELIQAKEKAEDAAKAKQNFASIMSHEIRTPLNAVIGMTNLLILDNPRPDQVNELNTLKFSAENLLLLVNDILDFSKIEAGKVILEKIIFEPRKIISHLQNSYKFMADEKGIFINVNIDDDIPSHLIGDTTRISQILNNLISNAVKFTEKGVVEISLRKITHLNPNEAKIRFEISDTGIGINEENLVSIFEFFSQANSDTTRKYGGSGLGLTITKKLIELHHSNIFIDSKVGIGSTFNFDIIFEIAEQHSITTNTTSQLTEKIFEGKRILLVEDNPYNQLIATRFLEMWGIEIVIAENGIEALHKLKSNYFDLILMDIHMPELNGIETTKLIRESSKLSEKNIPIIAITAAAMENDKESLLNYGMNDYISKPFNPEELQRKLAHFL